MCLKCVFFWKKAVKIAALGDPPPKPRWPPAAGGFPKSRIVIPAYCYSALLSKFLVLNAFYCFVKEQM